MPEKLLLCVKDAEISFGDKDLFRGLSFNICESDKICLIGKNGSGKTTLMNVITGSKELDGGERWLLQGTTIGYLRQEIIPKRGQTVFDFVFEEMSNAGEAGGEESRAYEIERVLQPLNLNAGDLLENLSGGQLRRAALARALVEEPDVLLMDEPTNHLDLEVIEWLENYLKSYRGAVVCVSHDKRFLENMSDKVFWLDRGRLRICPRGFAHFEEWSIMLLEQEERELHNRQKALNIEMEWASRGVKARRKRNVRRVDLMKRERDKLRADKNALNRMMAKIEFQPLETAPVSSRSVAEFHKVGKNYGEKVILEKFSLRIQRGDRIGIVGRNGSGKTSFLRLLTGEEKADAGRVKLAKEIGVSYFDQNRKELKPDRSLWRTLCPDGSDYLDVMGKTRHVCGYLKDFLFDPKGATQPVGTLSGGQKNRLLLAKVLAKPGGLLILDEPTNDLDMDTLDMLEEILSRYDGTLLVVSHDRDFLDQTVSKILAFEGDGKIEGYIGGYGDYVQSRKAELIKMSGKSATRKGLDKKPQNIVKENPKPLGQLSYKLKYELEKLPERISALENEIRELESALSDCNLYERDAVKFQEFSRRLKTAADELASAEARWLELDEMNSVI